MSPGTRRGLRRTGDPGCLSAAHALTLPRPPSLSEQRAPISCSGSSLRGLSSALLDTLPPLPSSVTPTPRWIRVLCPMTLSSGVVRSPGRAPCDRPVPDDKPNSDPAGHASLAVLFFLGRRLSLLSPIRSGSGYDLTAPKKFLSPNSRVLERPRQPDLSSAAVSLAEARRKGVGVGSLAGRT